MKDFYYILGTQINSTHEQIDEAYNRLSKKLAPDDDEKDSFLQAHFREISEAYEILSDPAKRRVYDAALKRNHKKHITNFKTSDINIAATGAFILFTALFGFYVVRLTHSTKPVEVVKTASMVIPHKAKHHKKRHYSKAIIVQAKQPVITKKDTAVLRTAKPVSVAATPVPVVVTHAISQPDSTYNTYLKADLAGSVYMHQMADYMSAVVTVLPDHCRLRVLGKGQTFYKVAFNDRVGYVPKWTILKP